ncbi:hypothetical protein AX14_011660 [Amanita brunnescens Koide BX004]|nr:hypothetical protein AX14_011660 [Amanita brunnescens Koide BX004]
MAVALSPNMNCVIGFRCLQATGSSAVIAIGASTLADIFGQGNTWGFSTWHRFLPSLGPILGGALTTAFGWRAIFWFLTIFAGISCLSFLLFRDTYRKERSLLYQKALKARLKHLPTLTLTITKDGETSTGDRTGETTVVDSEKGEGDRKEPSRHNSELNLEQVNLSLMDLNPSREIWLCLRRWDNLTIFSASGLLFGFNNMSAQHWTCDAGIWNRVYNG